jgi:hypothetical protein
MTSDHKKPGARYSITVAVVAVLVGYPLSFGPAWWIDSRLPPSGEIVSAIDRPVIWGWVRGP